MKPSDHEPHRVYARDGGTITCHFNYRKIERVLETSLVYRGAVANTAVLKELAEDEDEYTGALQGSPQLDDLSRFESDVRLLVTPEYDGLSVTARCRDGVLVLRTLSGSALPSRLGDRFASSSWPEGIELFGILTASAGRGGIEGRDVIAAIESEDLSTAELQLKLLPHHGQDLAGLARTEGVSIIPHTIVTASEVDRVAAELAPRQSTAGPCRIPVSSLCRRGRRVVATLWRDR